MCIFLFLARYLYDKLNTSLYGIYLSGNIEIVTWSVSGKTETGFFTRRIYVTDKKFNHYT